MPSLHCKEVIFSLQVWATQQVAGIHKQGWDVRLSCALNRAKGCFLLNSNFELPGCLLLVSSG